MQDIFLQQQNRKSAILNLEWIFDSQSHINNRKMSCTDFLSRCIGVILLVSESLVVLVQRQVKIEHESLRKWKRLKSSWQRNNNFYFHFVTSRSMYKLLSVFICDELDVQIYVCSLTVQTCFTLVFSNLVLCSILWLMQTKVLQTQKTQLKNLKHREIWIK